MCVGGKYYLVTIDVYGLSKQLSKHKGKLGNKVVPLFAHFPPFFPFFSFFFFFSNARYSVCFLCKQRRRGE